MFDRSGGQRATPLTLKKIWDTDRVDLRIRTRKVLVLSVETVSNIYMLDVVKLKRTWRIFIVI